KAAAAAGDLSFDHALRADTRPGGLGEPETFLFQVRDERGWIEHVEQRDEPQVVAYDAGGLVGEHRVLTAQIRDRDPVQVPAGRVDVDHDPGRQRLLRVDRRVL